MDTNKVKYSILEAMYSIIGDLSLEEVEDLRDALSIQEFKLTDNGEHISLSEVEKMLNNSTQA